MRLSRLGIAVLALWLPSTVGAATIVLSNGRTLEADRAWWEGEVLRYVNDGQLYDVPRDAVDHVEPLGPEGLLLDPDVVRSREALARDDAAEARRYARLALFRDPSSLPGLDALAGAQLALGQPRRALQSAQMAVDLDPRRQQSLELLGDALAAIGDAVGARERYQAAYDIEGSRRLRGKLDALRPSNRLSNARFRIRYDGASDEPLGLAVIGILDRTWEEYEEWLGFSPDLPVTVLLLTDSAFRDTTTAPGWAAALNDGAIRIPVGGIDRPTPELIRVLRHELAHSFLAARIGSAAPTWLHEGVAQWLEGGDPSLRDAELSVVARGGRVRPLDELEAPFSGLSETEATSAYAESLSAVAHLLRLDGPAGLGRFIAALALGRTPNEALHDAYDLGYAELQRRWETHLRTTDRRPSLTAGGR